MNLLYWQILWFIDCWARAYSFRPSCRPARAWHFGVCVFCVETGNR